HALAGAAGNLSADGLCDAAWSLEVSASQGNSDLAALLRPIEQQAGVVFESIQSLRGEDRRADAVPTGASPSADPALVRAHLERLRTALAAGDLSGSSEVLRELSPLNAPEGCREEIVRLAELIDSYEYDEAAGIVTRLLARFQGGENP